MAHLEKGSLMSFAPNNGSAAGAGGRIPGFCNQPHTAGLYPNVYSLTYYGVTEIVVSSFFSIISI